MNAYEVVIAGGGPGGLTAGLYCSRAHLKTVLLEKALPGGEILNTGVIEDYPGFDVIDARELAKRMENHARKFGVEIRQLEVTRIRKAGERQFTVETPQESFQAKAVIVATGGSPNKLGVPGERELAAKGVSYCAICDGPLPMFRNRPMIVVGGGDSALQEGLFLTKYASKVYIVHRRDSLRAQKILQERAFNNPKMEIILNSVVQAIQGNEFAESVTLKDLQKGSVRQLPVTGVFIFIGFTPNSHVLDPSLGIQKDAKGYLLTNEFMETSVPGIFAIGDIRHQLCKQITNAVGDGTTAAVAAERYIEGSLHLALGATT
ncbi:MAG: thioredoxin-disulfide reductase [Elusimicrobia bacterium]|nr:thioredoxin-disulfide reductase [Elusimicrobiota bacterium]